MKKRTFVMLAIIGALAATVNDQSKQIETLKERSKNLETIADGRLRLATWWRSKCEEKQAFIDEMVRDG